MQFRFSPRLTLVCLLLALAMLGMSRWQWDRHLQKQALISRLNESLEREPIALAELLSQSPDWDALAWRRVKLAGTFDFEHEFLLRNRTLNKRSGVHVITPLRIDGAADSYVLVDRGFIPLGRESREARAQYQRPLHVEMFGIVKNTVPPKLFAP